MLRIHGNMNDSEVPFKDDIIINGFAHFVKASYYINFNQIFLSMTRSYPSTVGSKMEIDINVKEVVHAKIIIRIQLQKKYPLDTEI